MLNVMCELVVKTNLILTTFQSENPGQTPRVGLQPPHPRGGGSGDSTSGVRPGFSDCNVVNFLSHDRLHHFQNGGLDPHVDLRKEVDPGSDSPAEDQLNCLFCVCNEIVTNISLTCDVIFDRQVIQSFIDINVSFN